MQPISMKIFQTATVPWDRHHMRVGKGYDVYHSEPLATPFDLIELPRRPPTNIDIKPVRHVLRNESDRQRLTSARVSASASFLPCVAFEAVASALRAATCNETNLMVVTSCTIDCPPEDFEHLLKLNETSSTCLNAESGGAERFTQCYGEYCITGYARQATFTAVSEYRTEDKAALEAYAASLDGSADHGQYNFGANMQMLDATQYSSHKISQAHSVHISGYNAESGLSKTFHNVDVSKMWDDFLANMSPVPQVATIQHYSTIFPEKIPRPTAVINLPTDVIDVLRDCTDMRSKAQSNPLRCAKRLAENFTHIENLLLDIRKHVSTDTSQLNSLYDKLGVLREKLESCQKRAALLKLLEQEKKRDSEAKSERWIKSPNGKAETFSIGLTPSTAETLLSHPTISTDLQKSSQVFIRHDTGANPICQYGAFPMAVPGRLIIGAEILSSRRKHGSNGWWARREGGIGEHRFGVEFSSEHYHGAEWRVTVWSIDGSDDEVYSLDE